MDERSAIVVATPGAEPVAASGYSAALLLDCSLMLMRADVRVVEESMRRWNAAVALVRGAEHGGSVMAVGPQQHRALQALVRMDPVGLIERELAERAEAGLPPAVRAARIGGDPAAVADYLDNDEFDGIEVLGPRLAGFGEDTEAVALLRAPLSASRDLARAVKHASAVRSARKEGGRLYVELDPIQLE
ncbi:MAG: hypothetical protein CSA64_02795 [Arachnia propionica]|nr:MAG: hypothetical protein CSA64_02795 [Arachnia propionica]